MEEKEEIHKESLTVKMTRALLEELAQTEESIPEEYRQFALSSHATIQEQQIDSQMNDIKLRNLRERFTTQRKAASVYVELTQHPKTIYIREKEPKDYAEQLKHCERQTEGYVEYRRNKRQQVWPSRREIEAQLKDKEQQHKQKRRQRKENARQAAFAAPKATRLRVVDPNHATKTKIVYIPGETIQTVVFRAADALKLFPKSDYTLSVGTLAVFPLPSEPFYLPPTQSLVLERISFLENHFIDLPNLQEWKK